MNYLSSLLLHADELLETVVHLLDGLVFSQTHAAFVRDVVNTTFSFGVLPSSTTDLFLKKGKKKYNFKLSLNAYKLTLVYLEVELSGGLFELGKISGQFGERNVDGCADGGSQVGWAEGQETVFVVVREGDPLLDFIDGVDQAGIDGLQVTTLLHGDDAQVIFLIAPDQEGLVDVVVDTTTSGPVAASVGSLEETISFLEEETILDELGLDFLGHTSQRVVSSLEFTFQACQAGDDFLFHLLVVGLSQAGVESIAGQGATATDAGGDDESALNSVSILKNHISTKINEQFNLPRDPSCRKSRDHQSPWVGEHLRA